MFEPLEVADVLSPGDAADMPEVSRREDREDGEDVDVLSSEPVMSDNPDAPSSASLASAGAAAEVVDLPRRDAGRLTIAPVFKTNAMSSSEVRSDGVGVLTLSSSAIIASDDPSAVVLLLPRLLPAVVCHRRCC